MKRKGMRNAAAVLVALVLTVGAVALLTHATKNTGFGAMEPQAPQTGEQVTELTVEGSHGENGSLLAEAGAFAVIVSLPVGGALLYCRSRRRGEDPPGPPLQPPGRSELAVPPVRRFSRIRVFVLSYFTSDQAGPPWAGLIFCPFWGRGGLSFF